MTLLSSPLARLRAALGALLCALGAMSQAQSPEPPLVIGVVPNVSARVILANYQPMRAYFEQELKRKVEIATAADLRAFHGATLRGDYDLVVTAANLGRVAQIDGRWLALATYEPQIPALLVANAANPNSSVEQIRGKSLALANPQSLLALRGLQWLRAQGLDDARDFKTVLAGNDDSLGALLRSGEAPLAMMSMGEYRQIGEETRRGLRIVAEFAKLQGFLVLANPKLTPAQAQQLKTLVLQFPKSEDGKKFAALAGVAHIREIGLAELEPLDAFLAATRSALAPTKP